MYIETKYYISLLGSTFDENATYLKLGFNNKEEIILQTKSSFTKAYNSYILVNDKIDLKNVLYYNVINYEIGNEIIKFKIRGKLMNTVSMTIQINPDDLELLTKIGERLK